MNFTGKNLKLVRHGLSLALDELHSQIATCLNVFAYAEELGKLSKL